MSGAKRVKIGATPGKLVLVAALGVTLVWVLKSNLGGSEGDGAEAAEAVALVEPTAAPPVSEAAAELGPSVPPSSPFGEFAVDGDWPTVSLDRLVRFDPMAKPQWLASGAPPATAVEAAPAGQSIEQLQQAPNAIIFVTGDERVAHIGSQEYRIGDMVGQFQITDISSQGIVLSPPEGEAPTDD